MQARPADLLERDHLDDADNDGIPNALEFLMRTDANDPRSRRSPTAAIEVIDNASYLTISYLIDPLINSLTVEPEFSVTLNFVTDSLTPILLSEFNGGELQRRTYRAQSPVDESPQFTRLGVAPATP